MSIFEISKNTDLGFALFLIQEQRRFKVLRGPWAKLVDGAPLPQFSELMTKKEQGHRTLHAIVSAFMYRCSYRRVCN